MDTTTAHRARTPADRHGGDGPRLEELDAAAIADRLVTETREINRLEARRLRTLTAFLARRVWEAEGFTGPAQWLRSRCNLSLNDAGRLIDTARGLGVLPAARKALENGEISRDHAEVLTGHLHELAPKDMDQGGILEAAEVAAEVDTDLVEAAKKNDPRMLARAAKQQRDERRQPQDPTVEARRRYARRRFRSWREDGMYAFDGMLPLVDGEKLETVLNALRKPDPNDTPAELRRTHGQATADALVALAEHGLRSGGQLPEDASPARANVTVIVDWQTLRHSVTDPDLRKEAEAAARLGFAGQVPAELVGRLLCDSSLARVVTGPNGLPIEAGEATPAVPAPLRRAVIARDRHCRAPGCDRPAAWCEVHHVVWRRFGGKTTITTLVLLCTRHHHFVHDLGWKLDLRADGTCVWTAPTAEGGRRWLTKPGDPSPYEHAGDDGIPIVAHGSLPAGADPRNGDDVRDHTHPATSRTGPVVARDAKGHYEPGPGLRCPRRGRRQRERTRREEAEMGRAAAGGRSPPG